MTPSGLPFDDFRALMEKLPPIEPFARSAGAGRMAEIGGLLSRCAGRGVRRVARAQMALFVGTHQGAAEPAADQAFAVKRRIEKLAAGEDRLNALALAADLGLNVYDLALDVPAGDITQGPAFEERDCAATMAFGMEAVGGTDLLCISAIETDGGRSARAILHALMPDTGDSALQDDVAAALACHEGRLADPLEVLRRLGGRETAAICGALLAARTQKVAVVIDGPTATAAAAVLHAMDGTALRHCLAADAAGERHSRALRGLGLIPIATLGLDPAQGEAAVLVASMVKAAVEAYG